VVHAVSGVAATDPGRRSADVPGVPQRRDPTARAGRACADMSGIPDAHDLAQAIAATPARELPRSVQPTWMVMLPLQQQSVLLLAARGPDGIGKSHPAKVVQRAYRATVLLAGRYGRPLEWGEKGDSFMCLEQFARNDPKVGEDGWKLPTWADAVDDFFREMDTLPHHFLMHLYHGAQILGYKHPDSRFANRWGSFYLRACDDLHLQHENERQMDARLWDWGRAEW
jgi:hypothetical protein